MSNLWKRVAEHLSGKSPVVIEWRGTSAKGFIGEVYQDGKQIKMVLVPWMGDKERLGFFLHETAHIKNEQLPDISKSHLRELVSIPGSLVYSKEMYQEYLADPSEKRAWEDAKVWLNYARHWSHLYVGRTAMDQKLNCLMEYPSKEK